MSNHKSLPLPSAGEGGGEGVKRTSRISLWLPPIALMAVIFGLSSCSALPKPPGIAGFDKFQHFSAYGLLGFLVTRAVIGTWRDWKTIVVMIASVSITAFYGATDEFHQRFVPNRSCDVLDWTADATGAIIGSLLLILLMLYIRRRRSLNSKH